MTEVETDLRRRRSVCPTWTSQSATAPRCRSGCRPSGTWRLGLEDESVVVVPSVTLDPAVPGAGSLSQAFEERFLFLLAAAASTAVADDLCHLDADQAKHHRVLPRVAAGVIPSHAMARLNLVSVGDSSRR